MGPWGPLQKPFWENKVYIVLEKKGGEDGVVYCVKEENNLEARVKIVHRNMMLQLKSLFWNTLNKPEENKTVVVETNQQKNDPETDGFDDEPQDDGDDEDGLTPRQLKELHRRREELFVAADSQEYTGEEVSAQNEIGLPLERLYSEESDSGSDSDTVEFDDSDEERLLETMINNMENEGLDKGSVQGEEGNEGTVQSEEENENTVQVEGEKEKVGRSNRLHKKVRFEENEDTVQVEREEEKVGRSRRPPKKVTYDKLGSPSVYQCNIQSRPKNEMFIGNDPTTTINNFLSTDTDCPSNTDMSSVLDVTEIRSNTFTDDGSSTGSVATINNFLSTDTDCPSTTVDGIETNVSGIATTNNFSNTDTSSVLDDTKIRSNTFTDDGLTTGSVATIKNFTNTDCPLTTVDGIESDVSGNATTNSSNTVMCHSTMFMDNDSIVSSYVAGSTSSVLDAHNRRLHHPGILANRKTMLSVLGVAANFEGQTFKVGESVGETEIESLD